MQRKINRPRQGQRRWVKRYAWIPAFTEDSYVVWLDEYWQLQECLFACSLHACWINVGKITKTEYDDLNAYGKTSMYL